MNPDESLNWNIDALRFKALKNVVIPAEDIAGKANMEHITRVLTLDDLFI